MSFNFITATLAAVLQAHSAVLDKVTLSVKNVGYKTYTVVSFPLIAVFTLIIFLIFKPPLAWGLFAGNLAWLLLLSIALTIVTNLIFYRALDKDKLGEMQTIDLLRYIPLVLFSSLFFTSERNLWVIAPALLAALAIVWSHWDGRRFRIAKGTRLFLIWALTAAPLGAIVSKTLLASWNPISLELVRSSAIALILGVAFWRHSQRIPAKAWLLLLVTNLLTSVAWILFYFSYQQFGIIYTTLLFLLQPLLVYFASVVFLKEPWQTKKALAFAVVLACIIIAQLSA